MKTIWIGYREVPVAELIRQVEDDVEWLKDLHQDIQRELACKQELLAWLYNDQCTMIGGASDPVARSAPRSEMI